MKRWLVGALFVALLVVVVANVILYLGRWFGPEPYGPLEAIGDSFILVGLFLALEGLWKNLSHESSAGSDGET